MSKITWEGGTLLAPVPVVMVTTGDMEKSNIITIAWTGIINSAPPMTYISVRPERFSHELLMQHKEFTINLVSEDMAFACDFCGVKSGRDVDKFEKCNLKKESGKIVKAPLIESSPISLECVVESVSHLGSHDMFIAKIVAVNVEETLVDDKGKLHLDRANLVAYSHGEYFSVGKKLGQFGFSVMKEKTKKRLYKKR